MDRRPELDAILKSITPNVYFQPPVNLTMKYPCIRYKRDSAAARHADNRLYSHMVRYLVTVIDRNPDSTLREQVQELPLCFYDRFYAADDLNHDVFRIFF